MVWMRPSVRPALSLLMSTLVRRLYLHVPFCARECPYCGFYKHTPGRLASTDFIDALLAELSLRLETVQMIPESIFMGGGTPSLLSRSHWLRLASGLADRIDLAAVREWTLEANPRTFDAAKAEAFRAAGVNRVSLGVQSWAPRTLATLGRDHTPDQAREAWRMLRGAGFNNLSLDLMFSIPGETAEEWQQSLDETLALTPDHLSCYNLTYEEDTAFLTRHLAGELDVDPDRDADRYLETLNRLETSGFIHYEVSNWARPGKESRHNAAYWRGEDYLGIGPGAVSTINGQRWKTLPDTAAYTRAALSGENVRTEVEDLTAEDLRLEALGTRLRTIEGAPESLVKPSAAEEVALLVAEGFLKRRERRLLLTRRGMPLVDSIVGRLV